MSKIKENASPLENKLWFGGASAMFATACTHPLDTFKVRIQSSPQRLSLYHTLCTITKNEGILSFYSGISAALLRQGTYTTTRFAVYDVMKASLLKPEETDIYRTMVCAITAGIIGGIIGTPFDLINIRMQNDGKLIPAEQRNYNNIIHGIYKVVRDEGSRFLFRGLGANMQRSVLMTSSQLATYDLIKQKLSRTKYFDNLFSLSITASLLSGIFATTVTSPIDVIKTRIMISSGLNDRNPFRVGASIVTKEGVIALFKGWIPSYCRLGPHTLIMFVCYEQLKRISTLNTS